MTRHRLRRAWGCWCHAAGWLVLLWLAVYAVGAWIIWRL